MRKNRWSNLFGDILAIGTVSTVALSAKHVAKKYGQKYKGVSINGLYLLDYAAGRIFGDGAKAQKKLDMHFKDESAFQSCLRFSAKIKKTPKTVLRLNRELLKKHFIQPFYNNLT